jgi:hypothetical protein
VEKLQTLVTARPEVGARGLILLGAFVSFVLSVVLSEAERGPMVAA